MVRTDWWAMPLLAGALLAGGVGARSGAPRTVFVNCETGDDAAGDGSRARPFLTPMRARNFVRGVHPFAREPVEVQVYGDCYPRNAQGNVDFSRAVLELEPGLDSGTKSAPISYTGDGRSRLLSGMKIPPSAWMPSAKNANVYAVDLLALGADPALFGSFLQPDNPGGQTMGRCTSRQAELFYGGKPMTIARYPNRAPSGDFRWLNISSVQDAQATFQVADERVLAWSQEPDVWIHGYWSFDWADSFVQVERIFRNTSTGKAQVSVKGPVLYGFSQRAKFYGINILSELDTPGEYYLDRSPDSSAFGTLYFWPPSDLDASEAFVSFGDYTLVLGGTAAGLRRADTALHALASGAAAHWSTIARTQAPAGQGLRSSGGGAVNKMKEETGADLFVSASVPSALSALFFASLYQLVQAETLDRAAQKHLRAAALAVFKAQEEGGGTGGDQWGRGAGREGGLFSTRAGGARPVAAVGWGIWDFYWEWGLQCLRHTLKVEASASSRRAGGTAEAGEGRDAAPGGSRKDAEALEYVKISGFGLHFSRVAGLRLVNGRHVEVLEVAVTNHGGLGLGLDGSNLRASHLEVAHIGCGAVQLSGGSDLCMGWDPNSCVSASGRGIEDAGNVLEHSSIHDFGRVCRAYMPGVAFEGAGHTVRSNAVYNAPHSGIFGRGNDCVFENNLLRDLAYESTDTGGFMTGRSWVRRGNVIANNRFERVKNTQGMSLGYPQVMGIYLDDMTSGYTIVGNHFVDLQLGIYIGGGRDLTVTSNTFEDIGDSSVRIDDRGLNWRHQLCTEGLPGPQTGFLLEQLRQVNYLVPPYATKYPSLASYPDIQPCKPTAIYIVHNTFSNSSQGAISAPHGVLVDKLNSFRHNAIPSRGTESRDVGGGGAASQPRPGLGGGWEHNSLGVKEDVQKDIFLETVLS